MSIARMSELHNSYRYYTVTVDEYIDSIMQGTLFYGGDDTGIRYQNILELAITMQHRMDEMACPKQTVEFRRFSDTAALRPLLEVSKAGRKGKLATFRIYVRYRYHGGWQGSITWMEEGRTSRFDSFLQMLITVAQILEKRKDGEYDGQMMSYYQLAIHEYSSRIMKGQIQNATRNYLQDFKGIMSVAVSAQRGAPRKDGCSEEMGIIVSPNVWEAYRKGGTAATFLIRILFREHATWQGTIYWREKSEKMNFRSFLEMLFMMSSAMEREGMVKWNQFHMIEPDKMTEKTVNG